MSTKRVRDTEEMKRRKLARHRFKTLIRSVVLNRIWLLDLGDQKFSLNVKRNVSMLIRAQRKVGMLTLAEKALIRTHNSLRTIEDRKKIVGLLAKLICFTNIPPKVRARLAPVIKFMVLNQGRTVIREGGIPMFVYFILTGEVEIIKKSYNYITRTYDDVVEAIIGPSDCFGDVDFLENAETRRYTFLTSTEVELLVVFEEDFNTILRPAMTKQWLDKKRALKELEYFNFLNHDQFLAACKMSVLRQFNPLESIYHQDKGQLGYVHFVLSGECMILQCLKMLVTQKERNKTFQLVNIVKGSNDLMFRDSVTKLHTQDGPGVGFSVDFMDDTEPERDAEQSTFKRPRRIGRMDLESIEISCGFRKPPPEIKPNVEEIEEEYFEEDFLTEYNSEFEHRIENDDLSEKVKYDFGLEKPDDFVSADHEELSEEHMINENVNVYDESEGADLSTKEKLSEGDSKPSSRRSSSRRSSRRSIMKKVKTFEPQTHPDPEIKLKPNQTIESHFIDVGSFTFGGIFGLGENLEHRVIMARTTVQCLLIPRFWLFQEEQNPGHNWQRRRCYLDSTVPSRKDLFKDFIKTRKWQKVKKEFIASILDPNSIKNPTKIQEIPIICRIVEAHED